MGALSWDRDLTLHRSRNHAAISRCVVLFCSDALRPPQQPNGSSQGAGMNLVVSQASKGFLLLPLELEIKKFFFFLPQRRHLRRLWICGKLLLRGDRPRFLSFAGQHYALFFFPFLPFAMLYFTRLSFPRLSFSFLSYPFLPSPFLLFPLLPFPSLAFPSLSSPTLSFPPLSFAPACPKYGW